MGEVCGGVGSSGGTGFEINYKTSGGLGIYLLKVKSRIGNPRG